MPYDVSEDWPELRQIDGTPQIDDLERQWVRSLRKRWSASTSSWNWELLQEQWYLSAVAFQCGAYCESLYHLLGFRENVRLWQEFPTLGDLHHRAKQETARIIRAAIDSSYEHKCDYKCGRKPASSGTHDLIDKIKQAYRIEDIAEKHTRLRGTHTLSGPCFLHAGSGSEFVIWVDEQRFACFGRCNLRGDVIDLVRAMNERGLEWQQDPNPQIPAQ